MKIGAWIKGLKKEKNAECMPAAERKDFCVRRVDRPVCAPVFSQIRENEDKRREKWSALEAVAGFAARRESKGAEENGREGGQGRRENFHEERNCFTDELFSGLASLRGLNVEERGYGRGGV